MSNKTSDKNVANVTKNDIDILNALIYVYEARLPNYNELMDSEVSAIKNILSDYTRQKQINEEHKKINGELRQAINTVEKEKGEWIEECQQKDKRIQELEKERESVLDLIFEYGQIDGEHHKTWVIDQIVRILTKDKYNEWIKNYVYDEETGDTYSWDKGIAP